MLDNDPTYFGDYVRQRVMTYITAAPEPRSGFYAPELEAKLVVALTQFLGAEKAEPIPASALLPLPEGFTDYMQHELDVFTLGFGGTPFSDAPDRMERVGSRERSLAYAELFDALLACHAEKKGLNTHMLEAGPIIYKRITTLDQAGNSLSRLEIVDKLDLLDKQAVICFGGLNLRGGNPRDVSSFAKQAETLLGGPGIHKMRLDNKETAIYCLGYPDLPQLAYLAQTPHLNADPEQYVSPMMRRFTTEQLLPALGLTNEPLLSKAQLMARLRKVNLFSYSLGSVMVKQLRNALGQALTTQGYDNQVVREALGEVFALNIHPICRLDDNPETGRFSSIYAVSPHDALSHSRADYAQYVADLAKVPALIPINESELLIWGEQPMQGLKWNGESGQKAGKDSLPGHYISLATEAVTYEGPQGKQVSDPRYLHYALRNAIGSEGGRMRLEDMCDPVNLITYKPPPAQPPKSFAMSEAIRNLKEIAKAQELERG